MSNKIMIAASFAAITIAAISNIYIYAKYRDAAKKAEEYRAEAAEVAADLDSATIELARMRENVGREREAMKILVDAQKDAGVGYAEVLEKLDNDDNACWLDAPIPPGVRDILGQGTDSIPGGSPAGNSP